nr:hypothetical protein [Tanacetum cinerariifolium]
MSTSAMHNAIIEAGGKDRAPMLAPVDACPNAKEMWKAIERLIQGENINKQDVETNLFWAFGKFTSRDRELLESYYSSKGKEIAKALYSPFESEHEVVSEGEETERGKEIHKSMALILKNFKNIYKPTNNKLISSSNTRCENVDDPPRIDRRTGNERHTCKQINKTLKKTNTSLATEFERYKSHGPLVREETWCFEYVAMSYNPSARNGYGISGKIARIEDNGDNAYVYWLGFKNDDALSGYRFWVCRFNTAYPIDGYGVLKGYGGYGVSIFMDMAHPCLKFLNKIPLPPFSVGQPISDKTESELEVEVEDPKVIALGKRKKLKQLGMLLTKRRVRKKRMMKGRVLNLIPKEEKFRPSGKITEPDPIIFLLRSPFGQLRLPDQSFRFIWILVKRMMKRKRPKNEHNSAHLSPRESANESVHNYFDIDGGKDKESPPRIETFVNQSNKPLYADNEEVFLYRSNAGGSSQRLSHPSTQHDSFIDAPLSQSREVLKEGESFRPGEIYVPEWGIPQRFENLQEDYSKLAETHDECSDTVRKLVTARQDLEHHAKLYIDMAKRYKELKEEHVGCGKKVEVLEKEKSELLTFNKDQTLRIQDLEAELAKKDAALVAAERMYAKRAKERQNLVAQLGQAEVEKFDCIQNCFPQTEEGILAALHDVENFDAYSDRKLYLMYDKLFEKEYPFVMKIASGYRHSVADVLKIHPDPALAGVSSISKSNRMGSTMFLIPSRDRARHPATSVMDRWSERRPGPLNTPTPTKLAKHLDETLKFNKASKNNQDLKRVLELQLRLEDTSLNVVNFESTLKEEGVVKNEKVKSAENIDDVFTKGSSVKKHEFFCNKLERSQLRVLLQSSRADMVSVSGKSGLLHQSCISDFQRICKDSWYVLQFGMSFLYTSSLDAANLSVIGFFWLICPPPLLLVTTTTCCLSPSLLNTTTPVASKPLFAARPPLLPSSLFAIGAAVAGHHQVWDSSLAIEKVKDWNEIDQIALRNLQGGSAGVCANYVQANKVMRNQELII